MGWYQASTFFVVFATASVLILQILITWLGGGSKLGYKLLSSEVVVAPSEEIDVEFPCTMPEDHYVAGLTFCESKATREEKMACYQRCRANSQAFRGGLYLNLNRRVASLARADSTLGAGY